MAEGRATASATLGFTAADFRVFHVQGFSARMQQIYERIRPKLVRLGAELAPDLARKLHGEFFPHVAKHMRRSVNPPEETWAAWGPSPDGYTGHGYLALCISAAGIHARAVVKPQADNRSQMACALGAKTADLERAFGATRIERYDRWDSRRLPEPIPANREFFAWLARALIKKTGTIDVGFGWPVGESLRLDRAELIDAFGELEPLYRILRSAGSDPAHPL